MVKKRKAIIDEAIQNHRAKIAKYKSEIEYFKSEIDHLKKTVDTTTDCLIEEFTGYKQANPLLKDLFVTNNVDKIFEDIQLAHEENYNAFGNFYNESGQGICGALQTSCGYFFYFTFSSSRRIEQDGNIKLESERVGIIEPGYLENYKPFEDYSEIDDNAYLMYLKDCILAVVAKGYYYVLKKTPDGTNQYKKKNKK